MSSLLAHLATLFPGFPAENLATEALAYIVNKRTSFREAFTDQFVSDPNSSRPTRYTTQAVGDGLARPDIIGQTDGIDEQIIIEAKFLAGLTENQPVAYFRRLSPHPNATLAFLVPESRVASLWRELEDRFNKEKVNLSPVQRMSDGCWQASFDDGRRFLVLSWRHVLAALATHADEIADDETASDIAQLNGLAELMDGEAFIPLRPEELTDHHVARRILNLGDLAQSIAKQLIAEEVSPERSPRGRLIESRGPNGHYVELNGAVGAVIFDPAAWAEHKTSPIWLRFVDDPGGNLQVARELLRDSGKENSAVHQGKTVWLPIPLLPAVEQQQVIDSAVAHIAKIFHIPSA